VQDRKQLFSATFEIALHNMEETGLFDSATAFGHCGKPEFLGRRTGTSQQNSFPSVFIKSISDWILDTRKKPKVWHQLAAQPMVPAVATSVARFFSKSSKRGKNPQQQHHLSRIVRAKTFCLIFCIFSTSFYTQSCRRQPIFLTLVDRFYFYILTFSLLSTMLP
jgi:hypothetical protein